MPFSGLRRALAPALVAAVALLSACGGGDVVSQFTPSRVVVFGDAFSDAGQRSGRRYTINDGTVNVWSERLAANYGAPFGTAAAGGFSYATGSARINAEPDAAGDGSTPTVKEQVDTFLAAQTPGSGDLVIVAAGIGDVVTQGQLVKTGAQTTSQAVANVQQAARDMGAQVRRLVQAGATHVVVVGTYDLGRSIWATEKSITSELTDISGKFNEQLLLSIVDLGANVLYVDAALYFNLGINSPQSYSLSEASKTACTSVDAGPGIGIGAGEINSTLCSASTLRVVDGATIDPAKYLFSDAVYPSAQGHRLFGDHAYDRIRQRW